MKLSELIREYIDLKIQGEPKSSEWSSIRDNSSRRIEYNYRISELEFLIDESVNTKIN